MVSFRVSRNERAAMTCRPGRWCRLGERPCRAAPRFRRPWASSFAEPSNGLEGELLRVARRQAGGHAAVAAAGDKFEEEGGRAAHQRGDRVHVSRPAPGNCRGRRGVFSTVARSRRRERRLREPARHARAPMAAACWAWCGRYCGWGKPGEARQFFPGQHGRHKLAGGQLGEARVGPASDCGLRR